MVIATPKLGVLVISGPWFSLKTNGSGFFRHRSFPGGVIDDICIPAELLNFKHFFGGMGNPFPK